VPPNLFQYASQCNAVRYLRMQVSMSKNVYIFLPISSSV